MAKKLSANFLNLPAVSPQV